MLLVFWLFSVPVISQIDYIGRGRVRGVWRSRVYTYVLSRRWAKASIRTQKAVLCHHELIQSKGRPRLPLGIVLYPMKSC